MNYSSSGLKDWFPLLLVLAAITLGTSVISGCSPANQHPAQAGSTVATTATAITTAPVQNTSVNEGDRLPNATEIAQNRQAFDTRVAQFDAAISTEAALTPKPPYTPFELRTQSPEPPTPTWTMGFVPGERPRNTSEPEYFTCWHGTLNGKLLKICAGHEDLGGDPQQGLLDVELEEPDQATIISDDTYQTPGKVGIVHLVSVDNKQVTVASEDNQHSYTFDIATRQWVSSASGP